MTTDYSTCEECQSLFVPPVRTPWARFCHRNCRERTYRKNNPQQPRIRDRVYKGDKFPPELSYIERMMLCNENPDVI